MLKLSMGAAALAAFALATGAYAQGTITPPASATGQPSAGAPNSNNSGISGTVAGSDNLRGNIGSAPNEAVGKDQSPVGGANGGSDAQSRSESSNGAAAQTRADSESHGAASETSNNAASARSNSNQSSVASNSDKTFDPSSLNLGKTSTPMKGLKNKARVEANERRITQQLNRAAASMTTQNPG